MAIDQTADAVQANAQYLAQGKAMVSVAQQIEQAIAGQLAVFGGMQQAVSDLSSAMQSLPGQLGDLSSALQLGGKSGSNFLEVTNQIVGTLGDFKGAAGLVGDTVKNVGAAVSVVSVTLGALVAPLAIVAAGFAALGVAAYSFDGSDAALLSLSAQLKGTGRDSIAAVRDIEKLVEVLNTIPGVSKDSATAIISEFSKVPEIGSELFKSLGSSVADFAAATGTDLPTAARKLAEAFADPAQGAKSLEDSLGTLSAAQLLNIESMAEMGDKAGAQAALLDAVKQATRGLAKDAMTPLGRATDDLSTAWDRFTTTVGNSQGISSAKSGLTWLIEKVAQLIDYIAQIKPPAWMSSMPGIGGYVLKFLTPGGSSRQASGKVRYPQEEAADQQVKAALEATRSFETQASAMDKLKESAKLAKDALKALEEQNKGSSVEANRLRDGIAGIDERLAGMTKRGNVGPGVRTNVTASAKPQTQKYTEDEIKLATERAGLLPEFAQEWELLNEQFRESTLNMEQLEKKQAELLAKQPFMVAKEAEQLKALTKERQDAADVRNKDYASVEAYMESQKQLGLQTVKAIEGRVAAMELEDEAASMAAAQNITLAEAIKRVNIERLKTKRDGPTGLTEGSPAYNEATDKINALTQEADRNNTNDRNAKARDSEKKAQKEFEQWSNNLTGGVSDSLVTAIFEGGEKGGEQLRKQLQDSLLKQPLKMFINAGLNYAMQGIGGMLGIGGGDPTGGGAGGAGMGAVGGAFSAVQAGYNLYTTGSVFGGAAGGAGGLGGMMAAMGPAAAAAAVMLAVINVLGGMRSDRKIGSGLMGTLGGKDDLQPWEEWREGGTLLSGPDFTTGNPLKVLEAQRKKLQNLRDAGGGDSALAMALQATIVNLEESTDGLAETVAKQNRAIQKGYTDFRDNVVKMGNSIGLAGSSLKDFAYVLDQQDLNFDGLKPEEIQEKITAAFGKAGTAMAKEILGEWKPVTTTTSTVTVDGQLTESFDPTYTTLSETSTKLTYFASKYALAGETAYETLERLSASFVAVNDASEALGYGLQTASVSAAAFASEVIDAFGGLEKFGSTMNAYMQSYYSDSERREALANRASREAKSMGFDISADTLLNGNREMVRAGVDSVLANTSAKDPMYVWAVNFANSISSLYETTGTAAPVVESLSNAVDELTQMFNGAKESLLNDAKSLSVDLLRAQGKEGEAKALERKQFLDGFVDEQGNKLDEGRRQELATQYDVNTTTRRAIDVQNERNGLQDELNALTDDATQALTRQRDALDGSNRALFDNVQAVKLQKLLAEELPGVVDKYLSPAQRRQSQYDRVTADLNAAGLKVSTDQLMGLSKAQIGAAAVEIYNLAGVSDESRLAIVRAAGALADLKDADVDSAFAALERAVDAQRTVLSEAITELTTVFETARDAAKSLFGEVESAVQYQGDEGRAFISNALRVATSTGYLPDSEKFTEAVSNATGALGQEMFATQAESDYQRLVLANELKGLQDISGDQLEKAKTQLETLEEQLKVQRQQVEALGGIDASVLSVEQAIDRLATAMNGAQATPRTPTMTLKGAGGASYDLTTGTGQTSSGVAFSGSAIKEAALKAISEGASPQQIYNIIRDSGFTVAQAEQMAGSAPGSLQKLEAEMGWAAAYGGGTGNYSKQSAHSASALVEPTAYDPTAGGNANQQIVSALQDVRAELIEVRKQNDQLQYAASRTADAVNGRPEAPMLVENV